MDYCLAYADRAVHHGFPAMVVLGGDVRVGAPRCVAHAWELREAIRARQPGLRLGGWANPHADAERQVAYLLDPRNTAEFYLTQIVSHHQMRAVERFLSALDRARVSLPGMFGVFYYRSASPRTLRQLSGFLPVPSEALAAEFRAGASADTVCLRTLDALRSLGIQHVYVSNLSLPTAHLTLERLAAVTPGGAPQLAPSPPD
jgi:hypothetical protein